MEAEKLVFYHSRHGEVVENIGEVLPRVRIPVLSHALIIKAVHLRDLDALVIAAQEANPSRETHFQREEKRCDLDRIQTSVHVVAHEAVVCPRALATELEKLD